MKIINSGNEKAIKDAGLWDDAKSGPQLTRDSIFSPAVEVLYPNRTSFSADSLAFVPYGEGGQNLKWVLIHLLLHRDITFRCSRQKHLTPFIWATLTRSC